MTTALYVLHAFEKTWEARMTVGVTVATQCATDVHVLVLGSEPIAVEMAKVSGVSKVWHSDAEVFVYGLAEPCAEAIALLGSNYDSIFMASNAMGKNILPRVSGLLKRPMLSEIISMDQGQFVRPIYAGNALETVRVSGAYLASYRESSFQPVGTQQSPCVIEHLKELPTNDLSTWVSLISHPKERPELAQAKYVVAGGRGLKSKEQFKLIEQLADCLGAAVGASRAAVDAGYVPNECQVGQTGKIVAPELYIAIGISGAIQHLAGMKSSKVIVAINNDPDAPIFKIADYGWVVDLFVAIPAIEAALNTRRSS